MAKSDSIAALTLVQIQQRPQRKLDDIVIVRPLGQAMSSGTLEVLATWLISGRVYLEQCICGAQFASKYAVAIDEAMVIHLKEFCPVVRRGPRRVK